MSQNGLGWREPQRSPSSNPQPGLEHHQGWGIHSLSGQPVLAPHYSHSKELPPDIQPKSSLLQHKTISPRPAIIYPFKELKSGNERVERV